MEVLPNSASLTLTENGEPTMTDNLKPCAHCGQLVPADELTLVMTDGTVETWCCECVDTDASYCDHCEDYCAGESVGVYHNGHLEGWCEQCATTRASECDCCHDLNAENDLNNVYVYGIGNQSICNSCLDENYYQCSDCGDYCLEDDIQFHDGCYYCPACAPAQYLEDYHHTGAEHFLTVGNENMQPYLGVELEMEFDTSDARENAAEYICTNTAYGAFYECKEDSSLGEYGMEVVTQPATPAYHMHGYDQLMLSAGTLYDATSHDNGDCGLHVHIDRAYFEVTDTPYASTRAAYIMDTIFSTCESQIVCFTRRGYAQLNHWAQLMNMAACKSTQTLDYKLTEYRSSKYTRYQAVNTENRETIELRLFRGTLNAETYYATLEFVAALAYLTRALIPCPEFAETLTWPDLKTELFAALKLMGLSSDELVAYLTRRGL